MPVQILLSQAATPPGSPGVARDDFLTGTPVQATAVGGPFAQYLWAFISKADDIENGTRASSAFGSGTSPTTSVDPIDVAGEYLIQVSVDSGSGLGATEDDVARIVFYAGNNAGGLDGALNTDPAELPQRMPAFREQLEDNVPDAIDPSGNIEGWAKLWLKLKAVINRIYLGKSWAWARVAQTGGGATVTSNFNVLSVTRTGVGTASVVFLRNMPNTTYAVVPTASGAVGGSCVALNFAVSGFDIERADASGSLVDADWAFELKVQP